MTTEFSSVTLGQSSVQSVRCVVTISRTEKHSKCAPPHSHSYTMAAQYYWVSMKCMTLSNILRHTNIKVTELKMAGKNSIQFSLNFHVIQMGLR